MMTQLQKTSRETLRKRGLICQGLRHSVRQTGLCLLTSALCVTAAEGWTRFGPKPGGNSKVRIEGTSTIHDWQVESPLVGGFIELGPNFPRSSQGANPGKLDVRAEVFVPVSSLKSVKKDGTPYSTAMDDIMHEKLLKTHHPRIVYRLRELSLKEIVSQEPAKFTVEAVGDLVVAGVTNQITFPAQIQIHPDNHLTITGEVPLKMTSFKIEPPAPKVALGLIKTGDDVKVLFHWEVFPR